MKSLHKLLAVTLAFGSITTITIHAMEQKLLLPSGQHQQTLTQIFREGKTLEDVERGIHTFKSEVPTWQTLFGSYIFTSKLMKLSYIHHPHDMALIAAFWGLPVTVQWGIAHLKHKPQKQARKNLKNFFITIASRKEENLELAGIILDMVCNLRKQNREYLDKRCSAALHTAACFGNKPFMQLLIDRNAQIEIQHELDRRTPLMTAALHGHTEIVDFLILKKANVNHQNIRGNTALIWATLYAHVDIVKNLLIAKANIDLYNSEGHTALTTAKEMHFIQHRKFYNEIIELLKVAGIQKINPIT